MSTHNIKIIDNKKILMSHDEWKYYKNLCRAYDTDYQKGEEFFREHFETNSSGVITFVRPPHKKYSSLEIYTFLISIMINQHLRLMHDQVDSLVKEAGEKYREMVQALPMAAKIEEPKSLKEK